ncbi:VOC family protein, partial [Vibrio cholerae]
ILLKYQRIQTHNKRLKRDCQRVAFPVPMSRSGCSWCV